MTVTTTGVNSASSIPSQAVVNLVAAALTGKSTMLRGANLVGNMRYIGATTWPTATGMAYYLNRGFNCFRLPFLWQNLLNNSNGVITGDITTLVESRLQGLDTVITYLTSRGAYVILDMHQGGRFWYSDAEGGNRAAYGTISGTSFTNTGGAAPLPGQLVTGTGVTAGTRMIQQLTTVGGMLGDYGNGTYQLDRASTVSSSTPISGTPGRIIGETSLSDGKDPTAAQFANVWGQLATRYRSNPLVIFELQNEPHDQNTNTLVTTYNTAISAIRATGATNLIKLDGNNYAGGGTWTVSVNGLNGAMVPNSTAMLNVVDRVNNYCFAVHEYWDKAGGTLPTCLANSGGQVDLAAVTAWARTNGKRLFLGEFGGGPGTICLDNQRMTLDYLEANTDTWIGWTYWGAFAGQAPFSLPDGFFFNTDPGVDVATGSVDFTRNLQDPRLAIFERYTVPRKPFVLTDLGWTKLKCWLRPNTPAAGSTFTWPDSSGNGRDFIQATAANQPTVYRSNGTSDGVQQTATQTLGNTTISAGPAANNEIVFLVVTLPEYSSNRTLLQSSNGGPGRQIQLQSSGYMVVNDQGSRQLYGTPTVNSASLNAPVTGRKMILALRGIGAGAGTGRCTINGATEAATNNATTTDMSNGFTGTGTTVLGPIGNANSPGQIHEVVICDVGTLSFAEFYRIVGRLASDHGISLVSGHPFALQAPLQ